MTLDVDGDAFVSGNMWVHGTLDIGYEVVRSTCPGFCGGWSVSCPSGKKVLGGGCATSSLDPIYCSCPDGETGWQCWVGDANGWIEASAICANVD